MDALKEIDSLPDGTEVSISGGEPGMLKRPLVNEIIGLCLSKKCDMDLITNGLFIKRYPDLLHHFKQISYHCVEYINDEIEHLSIDHPNVVYNIVVTKSNIDKLEDFFKRYPSIKFKLLANIRKYDNISIAEFQKVVKKHKDSILEYDTKYEFMYDMLDIG